MLKVAARTTSPDEMIQHTELSLAEREGQIVSNSWRITKPMRVTMKCLRRLLPRQLK